MTNKNLNLHDTTDAAIWAREFCKLWPSALCQIRGNEGVSQGDEFEHVMLGWFANAIMAGVDSEARKHQANQKKGLVSDEILDAVAEVKAKHEKEENTILDMIDQGGGVIIWWPGGKHHDTIIRLEERGKINLKDVSGSQETKFEVRKTST